MKKDNLDFVYIDLVNTKQVNNFGISYVEVKRLNNGKFISVDSGGNLLATCEDGYLVIEERSHYFRFLCLFEEDYWAVVKEFENMGYRIEDIIDIDAMIREALEFSPYWGEFAYEWIIKCPYLRLNDFKKELDKATKSSSYTQKFRHRVLAGLKE